MRFLAFVDLHGSKKAYNELKKKIRKEKPDFLVCGGDFTTFEHDIKHYMQMLSGLDGDLFLVHGNHEEESVVRRISENYKNLHDVHGALIEYKKIVILGWGGGGFTIRDEEFETWIKTIKKDLKQYKREGKKIIFVSHAPVYGTTVDSLYEFHRGNKSFTNFIKEYNVDVAICGHLHENEGQEDKVKKCRVYNPGPTGKVITL